MIVVNELSALPSSSSHRDQPFLRIKQQTSQAGSAVTQGKESQLWDSPESLCWRKEAGMPLRKGATGSRTTGSYVFFCSHLDTAW